MTSRSLGAAAASRLFPLAIVLGACADPTGLAPVASTASGRAGAEASALADGGLVGHRYLVRLRETGSVGATGARTAARDRVAHLRGSIVREFAMTGLTGYAADLSDDAVSTLRGDADVLSVEPDGVTVGTGLQLGADWALDRLDQRALPLSGTYVYGPTGEGATIYVLDSGIDGTHPEFGARAVAGGATASAVDCNGHGTHVAALAGGATFGVARGARIVGVRVLDCALRGSVSEAVTALAWVVQQKKARPLEPMVANLSLEAAGGSVTLDAAVNAAITAGVTVVVAAGNSSADACGSSPARVPGALTVGASDVTDHFASFSNSGSCVDLLAPGTGVLSAWTGGDGATRVMSGTSQAAPLVAGAAALYLSLHPSAAPAEVAAALVAGATTDVVVGAPAGTPARLLNLEFLQGTDGVGPRPQDRPRIGRRSS